MDTIRLPTWVNTDAPVRITGSLMFDAEHTNHLGKYRMTLWEIHPISGARPGDVVAVLGLGGLGHLGMQYAVKMGFKTVGIARGPDKEPLARKLGAHHYIDSQAQDPAAALLKLGGAKVVLATVTNGDAMSAVQGGLALNGSLMVIGAAQSLQMSPLVLISGRRSVRGWCSGTAIDSQDTLKFSALTGVRSMNEVYPLENAAEAYERMMSGKARFRALLTTGQ